MRQEYIWELVAKKLAGQASPEELRTLEEVLQKNPDLHYSVQTIVDLWYHPRYLPRAAAETAFEKHIGRMRSAGIDVSPESEDGENERASDRRRRKNKQFFWGALLLVILISFFAQYLLPNNTKEVPPATPLLAREFSTNNGSKSNFVLPDGTTVRLNAGSKLSYGAAYGKVLREVSLTGEAFFDVVKNRDKPFILHTKSIDIRVVGTTFDVKSYPEGKTETSLVKGSIEVTFHARPTEKVILKPNEKLIVGDDELSLNSQKSKPQRQPGESAVAISHLNYTKEDSTIVETAWVRNKLIFRNETFRELALDMERWYDVTIRFSDARAEAIRFTGIFENETIQQALQALQLSGKFRYSMINDNILISN